MNILKNNRKGNNVYNEIIDIILKWIIPFILTAIFGFIAKELRENRKENKAMRESMVSLLRSQIVGKVEQWIEAGYLPDSVRLCLEDLFANYKSLGGNHGVDKLVEQAYSLPPKKKEGI